MTGGVIDPIGQKRRVAVTTGVVHVTHLSRPRLSRKEKNGHMADVFASPIRSDVFRDQPREDRTKRRREDQLRQNPLDTYHGGAMPSLFDHPSRQPPASPGQEFRLRDASDQDRAPLPRDTNGMGR